MSNRTESAAGSMRIVVAREADALTPHLDSWAQLCREASEPNVFYEPALLLPALRHLVGDEEVYVVLVYQRAAGREDRLVGLFPLHRGSYRGLPVAQVSLWEHMHCFLTTPLVARDAVAPALEAFLEYLAGERASLIEWGVLGADGPIYEALCGCLERRGLPFHETRSFERAVLERAESAAQFLEANLKKSRRKSLRRNRRKLEEEGAVGTRRLGVDEDPLPWIEAFLAIEASGWKGREGTALQQSPEQRRFFVAAALELARHGKLAMLGLTLDDRFIAMQCNFRTAGDSGGSFSFKMAYDETFARFGPGTLTETFNIELFHDDPVARWEDSCCSDSGAVVEEFWQGRRRIVSLQAATSRGVRGWIARGVPLVRRSLRRLRGPERSRGAA